MLHFFLVAHIIIISHPIYSLLPYQKISLLRWEIYSLKCSAQIYYVCEKWTR